MPTNPARMLPRFLAPALVPGSSDARLPADESRHLTRVLRLGPGDVVAVFDGRGHEYLARVTGARDGEVTVALLDRIEPAPEPRVPFTLIQAILKGSAMDDVVRDATMLGAAAIRPVVSRHIAVKPALALRKENADRWRRIAVASAKQSRRGTVPVIAEPAPLEAALREHKSDLLLLFIEPSAEREAQSMRSLMGPNPPARAALVVGPEGGWADDEIAVAIAAGSVLVTLGGLTLRAETVPLVASAQFRLAMD
jgi:16S rRNA (uracil1498-N3)-methyltransferase